MVRACRTTALVYLALFADEVQVGLLEGARRRHPLLEQADPRVDDGGRHPLAEIGAGAFDDDKLAAHRGFVDAWHPGDDLHDSCRIAGDAEFEASAGGSRQ